MLLRLTGLATRRLSLTAHLFLCLGLMAAVPTLVLGAVQTRWWAALQVEQADFQNRLAAQALAREVGILVDAHARAVEALAFQVEAQGTLDPAVLQPIIERQRAAYDTFPLMFVADMTATAVAGDPPVDVHGSPTAGKNFRDRDYFASLLATRRTSISRVQIGRTIAVPTIQIVAPIRDATGEMVGFSEGSLDLGLIQVLAEQITGKGVPPDATILDAEGRVIAYSGSDGDAGHPVMRDLRARALYQPTPEPSGELRRGDDEHDVPVRAVVAPIATRGLGWTVVITRAESIDAAQITAAERRTLAVAAAAVAAGLALAAVISPWVSRPIAQLAAVAVAVGGGDFSRRPPRPADWYPREVRSLVDAVSGMISELRSRTATLEHQALHDALTDLPNRLLLADRLEQVLLANERARRGSSLLIMDLDRFKEVNDTLGHQSGDALLRQVSTRLLGAVRTSDTVARLGGDEFAVVLPDTRADGATHVARTILQSLEPPFTIGGQQIGIAASVGIAVCPEHGADAPTLMRHADVAMYVAKRHKRGHAVYAPEQDRGNAHRLALAGDLRRAIDNGELRLHYQPTVSLRTGRAVRVEALVRWQHPEQGLVPPDEFVPLAEEAGLIWPLSQWVLGAALAQHQAWRSAGARIPVAVNLSMHDLQQPELPARIADLLDRWGVASSDLVVEITETALMADPARTQEVLGRLRGMGIRLAIDDFGVGHSTFRHLKHLPVNGIKVDRSFVQGMLDNEQDAAIVRSTIDLAHTLGLEVVAEGVEDAETWARLASLGCDVAQGYYLSRPLPADALSAWLDQSDWPLEDRSRGAAPSATERGREVGARRVHPASGRARRPDLVRRSVPMDPRAQVCHNIACSAHGLSGHGNIGVHSRKEERYICRVCRKTFRPDWGRVSRPAPSDGRPGHARGDAA